MELVHPDALLGGEEFGKFGGEVDSAYLAGKGGAVEAAKLPEKLHMRGGPERSTTPPGLSATSG